MEPVEQPVVEKRFPRCLTLPDSIFDRLKRMSLIYQRSMSRIVELALLEYLPKIEDEYESSGIDK